MSQASQTFLWAEATDILNMILFDSCFWGWAQTLILGKGRTDDNSKTNRVNELLSSQHFSLSSRHVGFMGQLFSPSCSMIRSMNVKRY